MEIFNFSHFSQKKTMHPRKKMRKLVNKYIFLKVIGIVQLYVQFE